MSAIISNPTRLSLGMTGTFYGKRYRIAGRAVLGIMEAGSIYCWNEFNLETESSESATLVYEENSDFSRWKWFTMFEPDFPITAADAAMKRVGDMVNLDGDNLRVTRVDQSRVYHVEGKPPEGERTGSNANYFNAESGSKMVVVSWTGDEVECYTGRKINAGEVAAGFRLQGAELLKFNLTGGGQFSSPINLKALVILGLAAFLVLITMVSLKGTSRYPAMVRHPTQPCALTVGSSGSLDETLYHVVSHAVVEMAEIGVVWDRHEFYLQDDGGHEAWLIFGSRPDANDWQLFTPANLETSPTPREAGNIRLGDKFSVDGYVIPVNELFREIIVSVDNADWTGIQPGGLFFGLAGQNGTNLMIARWSASAISFYKGQAIPIDEVNKAFPAAAKK